MSTHQPKQVPVIAKKKQRKQDHLDMDRAEDEGFNESAQRESLKEAESREQQVNRGKNNRLAR
ncbi:MAG: hypothetical protein RLZ35_192 [Pseudomonadota bacterium]|jgi:hypothetical protein